MAVDLIVRAERVDAHGDGPRETSVRALPVVAAARGGSREGRDANVLRSDGAEGEEQEKIGVHFEAAAHTPTGGFVPDKKY